jgi:predicted lactoylglutathione lyase
LGLSAQFEYVNTLSFGTPGHSWLTLAAVLEPPVQVGIGFRAETQTQVDNFHATAMAAGGDDRGAPGYQSGGKTNYSACVFDPDGHYVYVACRTTEA